MSGKSASHALFSELETVAGNVECRAEAWKTLSYDGVPTDLERTIHQWTGTAVVCTQCNRADAVL